MPMLREMFVLRKEVDLDDVMEGWSRLKGVMGGKNVADAVVFLAAEDSEFVTN